MCHEWGWMLFLQAAVSLQACTVGRASRVWGARVSSAYDLWPSRKTARRSCEWTPEKGCKIEPERCRHVSHWLCFKWFIKQRSGTGFEFWRYPVTGRHRDAGWRRVQTTVTRQNYNGFHGDACCHCLKTNSWQRQLRPRPHTGWLTAAACLKWPSEELRFLY